MAETKKEPPKEISKYPTFEEIQAKSKEELAKKPKPLSVGDVLNKNKISLNKTKLEALIKTDKLADIYYLSATFRDQELQKYILHAKENITNPKSKIFKIIKTADSVKTFKSELINAIVEELNDNLNKIKDSISTKRKKGIDVFSEEMVYLTIPLKIKLFSATHNKKEYFTITKKMSDLTESLKKHDLEEKQIDDEKSRKEIESQTPQQQNTTPTPQKQQTKPPTQKSLSITDLQKIVKPKNDPPSSEKQSK